MSYVLNAERQTERTMTMTQNPTDARNRDFERIWVGDRQLTVTHFFSIGSPADADYEDFAYGYLNTCEVYCQGIARFDGEEFFTIHHYGHTR